MSLDLTSEINAMISDRNMSEEQVISLIHDMIKSAYKKKYGTDENCLIEFDDTMRKMSVYQIRKVVKEENWYSEFTEIPVEDAIELTGSDDIAEGDEVKILLDPKNFESASVQSAKQRGQQIVKEYFNDKLYADNKRKEGKLIYGEIKRKKDNGDYAVNIGLDIEANFPLRAQSPRESYSIQQKYKFLVERVEKADAAGEPRKGRKDRERGVRIFLTRSSKDFVRALVENEVPEIASGEVEIRSIARQAGVRTKIAVDTRKSDIDPVGAVVGAKGLRIQAVMTECEGEKIDIIRYSEDPLVFIAYALIPAQVQRVVVMDPRSKHIVAIVDDNQLGIAIGQGGVNVKLAKMLCDWNIEVKTPSQFAEMEQTQRIYENVEGLFKNDEESENIETDAEEPKYSNEDIGIAPDDTPISEIGLDNALVEKLQKRDIWSVEEFFEYSDEELKDLGFTDEEIQEVRSVVVIEEDDEYSFECPNCHSVLPAGTTKCPNCGVEFEFE